MQCQVNGKSGWKFGDRGHCYTGENGKEQARAQMRAMYSNGYQSKKTFKVINT